MLSGLRIAVAALDDLIVSGGGTLTSTKDRHFSSGPFGMFDTSGFEQRDGSINRRPIGTRGFATGKDPDKEWKIRTTQQILADLNLQGEQSALAHVRCIDFKTRIIFALCEH